MTNGSPCIVQLLDFRVENSTRCSIIWVKFENKSTEKLWREKYAHLFIECIPKDWTPILEPTRSFTLQHYTTYYVTRRQFPLQVAAGKTIHKSQGSTVFKTADLYRSILKTYEKTDISPRLIYWDCVKHEFYKTNFYTI